MAEERQNPRNQGSQRKPQSRTPKDRRRALSRVPHPRDNAGATQQMRTGSAAADNSARRARLQSLPSPTDEPGSRQRQSPQGHRSREEESPRRSRSAAAGGQRQQQQQRRRKPRPADGTPRHFEERQAARYKKRKARRRKAAAVRTFLLLLLLAFAAGDGFVMYKTGVMDPLFAVKYAVRRVTNSPYTADAKAYGTTTFQSVATTLNWTYGQTEQPVNVTNPSSNDAALTLAVYVDLNDDGEYSSDECLAGADGSVTVSPGLSRETVSVGEELATGTYQARVSLTPVGESGTRTNTASFETQVVVSAPAAELDTPSEDAASITYSVIYDPNETSVTSAVEGSMDIEEVLNTGDVLALSDCYYRADGYSFVEWNTSPDGTGRSFAPNEDVSNLTATNGKVIRLYAIWEQAPYTIELPTSVNLTTTSPRGAVSARTSYDIKVTGEFADVINVEAQDTRYSVAGYEDYDLTLDATTGSADSALAFSRTESKQDTVTFEGRSSNPETWRGSIEYVISRDVASRPEAGLMPAATGTGSSLGSLEIIHDTELYLNDDMTWGGCQLLKLTDTDGTVHYGLIDGGIKTSGRLIAWLQARGVSELDFVLVTHVHQDHETSIPELVQQSSTGIKVNRIYMKAYDCEVAEGTSVEDQRVYNRIVASAAEQNIPIIGLSSLDAYGSGADEHASEMTADSQMIDLSGAPFEDFNEENTTFTFGDATVVLRNWQIFDDDGNVLDPADVATRRQHIQDENDDSLCVSVYWHGRQLVFTGDMNNFKFDSPRNNTGAEEPESILQNWHDLDTQYMGDEDRLALEMGRADFLQAGHHGGHGSSTPRWQDMLDAPVILGTAGSGSYTNGYSTWVTDAMTYSEKRGTTVVVGAQHTTSTLTEGYLSFLYSDANPSVVVMSDANGWSQTVALHSVMRQITLDAGEGSGTYTTTRAWGSTLGTLTVPQREGYVFEGWADASGNIVTSEACVPATDITLTAVWVAEDEAA